MYPEDLKYTKEHQWLKVEGDQVTIGITHYAQESLGDIVFVELPSEGDEIEEGESLCTVESVKAVSEMYSAVSGRVIAVNEELADSPEKINEAPYGDGWMVTLEVSGMGDVQLLTAEEYQAFLEEEA